jgi:hypothetical protein
MVDTLNLVLILMSCWKLFYLQHYPAVTCSRRLLVLLQSESRGIEFFEGDRMLRIGDMEHPWIR